MCEFLLYSLWAKHFICFIYIPMKTRKLQAKAKKKKGRVTENTFCPSCIWKGLDPDEFVRLHQQDRLMLQILNHVK